MLLVEIKDFNALLDNKSFFGQLVKKKKKQESFEKPIEMSKNNDYTTGNLLTFSYHQNYFRLIDILIDSSRQTNENIPQQVNSKGKLKEDDGATMFFIVEKKRKTILNFSLDSLIVTE